MDSADKVGELQWAPEDTHLFDLHSVPELWGSLQTKAFPAPFLAAPQLCGTAESSSRHILHLISSSSSSFLPTPAPFPCCHLCLLWLSDLVTEPGRALLVAWMCRGDFLAFLNLLSHAAATT